MEIIDKFLVWIRVKMKLNMNSHKPPIVQERDIWWISFGQNIGTEINGKSVKFSRPGIILKKLSSKFYLVAPTTSKERTGNWYITIKQKTTTTYVCLHQIRTIDYRRLYGKMGQINEPNFILIKKSFIELYK